MATETVIGRTEQALSTVSTTMRYAWYSGWLPATGVDSIRSVLQARNLTGNFEAKLAYQVAAVREDNPSAPVAYGAYQSTNGAMCSGDVDISSDTTGAMLIRFGVGYDLSTGSSLGTADVHLELAYNSFGRIAARREVTVLTPDTSNYFEPLTPFLYAAHVAQVKAALIVSQSTANFQCRLAYRVATNVKEAPSSWSTTWDAWHTGDGEYNTGELAPSASMDMFLQIGLQHSMSSGTNGHAQVLAVVATRSA